MSGIPVKDQKWSGLPTGTTDYTVIRNSNFENPIHQLVVNRKFAIVESPVSDSNASKSMESSIDRQVSCQQSNECTNKQTNNKQTNKQTNK